MKKIELLGDVIISTQGWSVVFKIVLAACILCLVYTVATTSILRIEPTDFGLISGMPLTYFIGLILVGCLWFIGLKSNVYLSVALVFTFFYLFFVPTIVREPVWISNSYYPFGESSIITSTGHLTTNPVAIFVSYHFWPLFLYFASAFTIMTGISNEVILKFFPLLLVALYGLFAWLILRIKLPSRFAILGSGIFLASLFIRQQYFGPQSIVYIFFLCFILITSLLVFDQKAKPKILIPFLVFLFLVTTLAHPLTSFMCVVSLAAFYVGSMIVKNKASFVLGSLTLATTIIWLNYNVFAATIFFNTAVQHFIEIFSGARGLGIYSEPSRIVGSSPMIVNFVASWAIVGIGILVALLAIVQVLWRARTKRMQLDYLIINVVLLVLIGLFAFVGEYGAVEAYQRAFLFGLAPLSLLCVSFLSKKPKILVAFVVLLIFLNIPAQYGSDTFRLATSNQLYGTAFVADYTPDNITLVGGFSLYIRYHDPFKRYEILDTGLSSPFTNLPNSTELAATMSTADYVMVSEVQHNYYLFYIGYDPVEAIDFQNFNRIYDNGEFQLLKP